MRRLKQLCATGLTGVVLAALGGCDSNNVSLPDVPPVEIPPASEPEVDPATGKPMAGDSSGMNFNPGGLNN